MSEICIQKTGEPDVIEASDARLTLSVPIQIEQRYRVRKTLVQNRCLDVRRQGGQLTIRLT